MTIIPVNEKYRIALDSHSWMVQKRIKDKRKADGLAWSGVAWFPKLDQACEWLLERDLSESDIEGAVAVENAVRRFTSALSAIIEGHPCCNSWHDEKNRIANAQS